MFGQHANTESPVDAATPHGLALPEQAEHREPGLPTIAVNTVVGLAGIAPEEAMLAAILGIEVPVAKGEITGIDDAPSGQYDVSSPCPDHGSHTYKAQFTGQSITNPETNEPAPLLFLTNGGDDTDQTSPYTD